MNFSRKRPSRRGYKPTIEELEVRSLLATHFLVEGFPTPVTAGVEASFTVTAENADNTVDTRYLGTVHFTNSAFSSNNKTVLPTDYTFTAGDAGSRQFSLRLLLLVVPRSRSRQPTR
jgi:hypothetical protein